VNCHEARRHLSDVVDGELPTAHREAVEGHVSRCPPCERVLLTLRATVDIVRVRLAGSPPQAPSGLHERVMRRVRSLP
jgi:anti-sigma factor (TIGR02949 family)